jgi:hypothetical protein
MDCYAPCRRTAPGYAIKCEDGNPRPLRAALGHFLDEDLGTVPVVNSRGEAVGEGVVG